MEIKDLSFFVCLVYDHISPCLFCLVDDMSMSMRVGTKSITIINFYFIFRGGLCGVLKWPGSVAVLSISFKTNCKKSQTRITATASILKQYYQTHEKVECLFNTTKCADFGGTEYSLYCL